MTNKDLKKRIVLGGEYGIKGAVRDALAPKDAPTVLKDLNSMHRWPETFPHIANLPPEKYAKTLRSMAQQFRRVKSAEEQEIKDKIKQIERDKKKAKDIIDKIKDMTIWDEACTRSRHWDWQKCEEENQFHSFLAQENIPFERDLDNADWEKETEFKDMPHVFKIEHNWAKVFEGAEDFKAGDYRLPFELSVFEFQLNGFPIIAVAKQTEGGSPKLCVTINWEGLWIRIPVKNTTYHEVGWQIRAACIAMEADAAMTSPERVTYSGQSKDKKPLLQYSYHVVSLKKKARPDANDAPTMEGRRKRLHFRRGHWRHYEYHKVWVKWTLVGDLDLGFVDKDYKL